ncbi:MAG TPA: M56 family metallopeptidase [Candidatus Cybelea sp.]|jgi:TonB family protein
MIASILLNGLWQGAPIVAIGWVLSRLLPKQNAATRYAIWFGTLVALALVPLLTTAFHAGANLLDLFRAHPSASTFKISLIPTGSYVAQADTTLVRIAPSIVALWLAGVCVAVARLAISFARIERIRRRARPLAGAEPDTFVSDDLTVPIVAGIVKPAIVIPVRIANELAVADLRRIVEHERAHIRRHDPICNLVQRLVEAALFFNPWVHFAGRNACLERETACDDWVVEKVGGADDYAACLALLARSARAGTAPLLTPSAFRSRRALIARLERLASRRPRHLTVNSYALGGAVMLFLITTLTLQAFSPALALGPTGQSSALLGASAVAATCANPVAEATVTNAVAPELPHGLKVSGSAEVVVMIAANGHVMSTSVIKSSGNAAVDNVVVQATRKSTYSPEIVNCKPAQGGYIFRADFAPSP